MFCFYDFWPLKILHVNRIMWYLFFHDWFILLGMMSASFIYAVQSDRISLFPRGCLIFHLYENTTFCLSVIHIHIWFAPTSGLLPNNAAVTMGALLSPRHVDFISCASWSSCRMLRIYDGSSFHFFFFWGISIQLSIVTAPEFQLLPFPASPSFPFLWQQPS